MSEPTPRALLLAGPEGDARPGTYWKRMLGPRTSRQAFMLAAVALAQRREVDEVHLINADVDLSLTQLAEFACALRAFGCELMVPDLPGLSPESPERGRLIDCLIRIRLRDRKRHRGASRLRSVAGRKRASPAIGRPRRSVDLAKACALLEAGDSVKAVARLMGVPRSTLQRRLEETGWVRAGG